MLEIFNALIACLITTITLYIAGTIIFGKSKNTTLKNIVEVLDADKKYIGHISMYNINNYNIHKYEWNIKNDFNVCSHNIGIKIYI